MEFPSSLRKYYVHVEYLWVIKKKCEISGGVTQLSDKFQG